MKDWWSEETREQFGARQKCFVDEYDGYGFRSLDNIPGYEGRKTVDGNRNSAVDNSDSK